MPDPLALVLSINQHEADLRRDLGAQAPEFFAGRDTFLAQATEAGADQQAALGAAILAYVDGYPAAARLLRAADPNLFGPPAPAAKMAPAATNAGVVTVRPPPAAESAATVAAVAAPAGANGANAAPSQGEPPPASPTASGPPSPPPVASGAALPAAPTAPTDARAQWLKEVVAAALGLLLVGGTVVMAFVILTKTGPDLQAAKDILLVLTSLTGVVLGYYFGRIPSDARAAQAQQVADRAQQETAEVKTRARGLADQVESIVDRLPSPGADALTRGGAAGAGPDVLRQDLREVARQARRL
jgi:hypothetical protein